MRAPVERRVEVVGEFRRSGLSGAQFARLAGMKYPTLMAWVKRDSGSAPAVVRKKTGRRRLVLLKAVVADGAGKQPSLVFQLGVGVRMELTEAGEHGAGGAPDPRPAEVMLSFCGSLIIYEAVEPCDMRKGFNGLQGGQWRKSSRPTCGMDPFCVPQQTPHAAEGVEFS